MRVKVGKQNSGITLIALVITIIVLLILAGISIATLTGENGILTKASTAKRNTEKASAKEQVQLAVLASKDINGILNIDKLKEELRKIQGTVTITDTDGGFPITVIVDKYSFTIDERGNVELIEPKPIVDQSSIRITLKDGKEIPTEKVDEGTELKITFTASIEDGYIRNVFPGTVQNGQVTYTTTGKEKEVTFKIIAEIENDTYETLYIVPLKEYYKKTEVGAEDIKNAPHSFYGAEVTGYTCPSDGVSKWRIFYADSSNIYLIADDYIHYTKAPDGQSGSKIVHRTSDYILAFDNVYLDYPSSAWMLGTHTEEDGSKVENSLAKKWLNKYFNYTPDGGTSYPNRSNGFNNIRAVAYLMDTKQWRIYAGSRAEYAIGGPPIELYWNSYTQTHEGYNVGDLVVPNVNGYNLPVSCGLSGDYNEIYVKTSTTKAPAVWLASPHESGTKLDLVQVCYNGYFNNGYGLHYGSSPGLRPIVCLKSDVLLKKISNGVYTIQ